MPELPEVTALAAFLTEHAAGQPIVAVTVASLNVLTTYDPPATALVGRVVTGAGRHGKFLDLVTGPGPDTPAGAPPELHLLVHLARAGWLRWSDAISAVPPKMGGPIALRIRLDRRRIRHHRGRHQEVGRGRDRRRPEFGPRGGQARS